jgi:hypothetical protein
MGKHEMAVTTARLLAAQLRSAERRAERYEAALRAIAVMQNPTEMRRVATDAVSADSHKAAAYPN